MVSMVLELSLLWVGSLSKPPWLSDHEKQGHLGTTFSRCVRKGNEGFTSQNGANAEPKTVEELSSFSSSSLQIPRAIFHGFCSIHSEKIQVQFAFCKSFKVLRVLGSKLLFLNWLGFWQVLYSLSIADQDGKTEDWILKKKNIEKEKHTKAK